MKTNINDFPWNVFCKRLSHEFQTGEAVVLNDLATRLHERVSILNDWASRLYERVDFLNDRGSRSHEWVKILNEWASS